MAAKLKPIEDYSNKLPSEEIKCISQRNLMTSVGKYELLIDTITKIKTVILWR